MLSYYNEDFDREHTAQLTPSRNVIVAVILVAVAVVLVWLLTMNG